MCCSCSTPLRNCCSCRCRWPFSPSWCHWSRSSCWFWQSAGVTAKWLGTTRIFLRRVAAVEKWQELVLEASKMGGLCWFTNKWVILLAICFVGINALVIPCLILLCIYLGPSLTCLNLCTSHEMLMTTCPSTAQFHGQSEEETLSIIKPLAGGDSQVPTATGNPMGYRLCHPLSSTSW